MKTPAVRFALRICAIGCPGCQLETNEGYQTLAYLFFKLLSNRLHDYVPWHWCRLIQQQLQLLHERGGKHGRRRCDELAKLDVHAAHTLHEETQSTVGNRLTGCDGDGRPTSFSTVLEERQAVGDD